MARIKVSDISFDTVDVMHLVEKFAHDSMLIEVLSDRGYWVFENNPTSSAPLNKISFDTIVDWLRDQDFQVTYPGDRTIVDPDAGPTDFDKWTQIWTEMDRIDVYSDYGKIGILTHVVRSLLDLLQPASVRATRTNQTEAKKDE